MASHLLLLALLALASSHAVATDPTQLQDFCVADLNSNTFVNGFVCKNPNLVTSDDFFFSGLNQPGNASNQLGSVVTPFFVNEVPGLNTLGIAIARVDFEPGGINPPHTHPRASEILTVRKGTLAVGFVTSNPDNRLFAKVLHEGDAFAFPQGLIHFQLNIGKTKAVASVSLSSQNPGIVTIGKAIFGAQPHITPAILEKAFQLDRATVEKLQAKFWTNNT